MTQPLLNSLPTIITGPDIYQTRDGSKAVINAVQGPGTFSAKGALFRMFRGKLRPRGYEIWHVSGRIRAVGEHHKDIVKAIDNPAERAAHA